MATKEVEDRLTDAYGSYAAAPPNLKEVLNRRPELVSALTGRIPWEMRKLSIPATRRALELGDFLQGPGSKMRESVAYLSGQQNPVDKDLIFDQFLEGLKGISRSKTLKRAVRAGKKGAKGARTKIKASQRRIARMAGEAYDPFGLRQFEREVAEDLKQRKAEQEAKGKEVSKNPAEDEAVVRNILEDRRGTQPVSITYRETISSLSDGDVVGLIGPILFMVYRTKLDGKEQIVVDGMNRIFRDPLFVKGVLDLFVKLSEKYPSTEDKMHPQFEEAISGAPLYFDGSGQNFYFVSHMSDRGITNERILPKSSADARKKELIRTLETFHGTGDPVENRGTVELQNLEMGDVLGKFGELITIGYRNDRLNEPATYIHSFNDPLESKHFKDFQRPADAALKKAAGNPRSTGEREKALQRMDAEMSKGPLLFVHDDLSTFQFQAEIGANRITPVR